MSTMATEAIRKTVLVDFTPEEAFELFTTRDRLVVADRDTLLRARQGHATSSSSPESVGCCTR